MSVLKVAKLGNPVLRQMARPVAPEAIKSPQIQRLIRDMIATMREYGGVGLAAPQVHESVQIAVIEGLERRTPDEPMVDLQVLINPVLTIVSDEVDEDWEGCLSIPNLRAKVPRHREIQVRAIGPGGQKINLRATGFHARVIQHEYDHLIGKVYLDRMRSFESLTFLPEFSKYWQEKNEEPESN
jgi:peptide deformylase